jgi:hypothetical protein
MNASIVVLPESHTDHGLSPAHMSWLLAVAAAAREENPSGVMVKTFDLPLDLSPLESGLYGPLAGDEPVKESEASYAVRGTRKGLTRFVARPMRETRRVTVVVGPYGDHSSVLFTAYGGEAAPREPFDVDESRDPEGYREAGIFWGQHALSESLKSPA